MGRRTDNDANRLHEFREEQRARYLLPTAQLAADLARERGFGERELFGASLIRRPDTEEERRRKEGARFPDEIAALRAFVRATVVLDGANGQMTRLAAALGQGQAGPRRGRSATIKVSARAGRVGRVFEESANSRLLDDFVDVGNRLRGLPPDRLRLLIERYVFGLTARKVADELGCSTSSIGGQLGQARRALRRALAELLPAAPPRPVKPPVPTKNKQAELLNRAARHLRKCLEAAAEEKVS